jgi:hypothetical protein
VPLFQLLHFSAIKVDKVVESATTTTQKGKKAINKLADSF